MQLTKRYFFKIYIACFVFMMISCLAVASANESVVSVQSFGAKGDGQTNDTDAFLKAFSSGRFCINIPAGNYILGPNSITIPANVSVIGEGKVTVLKPVKNTSVLFKLSAGVRIKDLTVNGEDVKSSKAAGDGLIYAVRDADYCVIDSISVINCGRACIVTDNADDLLIQNCYFKNIEWAVSLQFSNRVKVLANTVINSGSHAFQFWGNWNWESKKSEDLIFANNYVKDGGNTFIWGAGAKRVIIANNIGDGAKDVGYDLEWCDDSVITGNIGKNVANAPISLFFACKRISITGNTVVNDRPLSDKDKAAIFTVLQKELTEDEKEMTWYVRSGIWLTSPNRQTFKDDQGHEDITIVGNTIHTIDDGIPRRDMWIGAEVKNVRIEGIEGNTLSDHGVYYGGHHMMEQNLIKLGDQPLMIDNMLTSDKAKY